MKLALLLLALPLSAATITGDARCGDAQSNGITCSGPNSSASTVINGFDVRVDASANSPYVAAAQLSYDAMFDLMVPVTEYGSGQGFVLPVMTITYIGEEALTSEATASLGNVTLTGNSTNGGTGGMFWSNTVCYGCRIPITFGVSTPVEFRLDVQASVGFALFPPRVTQATSWAEASLVAFLVFDGSGREIGGAVNFTEAAANEAQNVPEPGYIWLMAATISSVCLCRQSRKI
jgi:hypothetical protein